MLCPNSKVAVTDSVKLTKGRYRAARAAKHLSMKQRNVFFCCKLHALNIIHIEMIVSLYIYDTLDTRATCPCSVIYLLCIGAKFVKTKKEEISRFTLPNVDAAEHRTLTNR